MLTSFCLVGAFEAFVSWGGFSGGFLSMQRSIPTKGNDSVVFVVLSRFLSVAGLA